MRRRMHPVFILGCIVMRRTADSIPIPGSIGYRVRCVTNHYWNCTLAAVVHLTKYWMVSTINTAQEAPGINTRMYSDAAHRQLNTH